MNAAACEWNGIINQGGTKSTENSVISDSPLVLERFRDDPRTCWEIICHEFRESHKKDGHELHQLHEGLEGHASVVPCDKPKTMHISRYHPILAVALFILATSAAIVAQGGKVIIRLIPRPNQTAHFEITQEMDLEVVYEWNLDASGKTTSNPMKMVSSSRNQLHPSETQRSLSSVISMPLWHPLVCRTGFC